MAPAPASNIAINTGTSRRQMNRSIICSASAFIAQRGHPRAVASSSFPQSRHAFFIWWAIIQSTVLQRV